MDTNTIVGAITTLGLPTCLLLYYLWRSDKDKKEYNEKIDKKDAENRAFTNKLVDNLNLKITSLEDERNADKKIIQDIANTNKQLAETNAKLYSTIDNKIENIDKKVDKIETLVERINK